MNSYKSNFWFYSLGRLVSLIGSGVQQVAIPLFILDLTGSGTIMGTFVLVSMLPKIILGPFAGVLGDRFDRKKIMIYTDFVRGGLILLLALMAGFDSLTLISLLIVQGLVSSFDMIFDPATNAMIADIVPDEDLTRANSIVQGINSFSYIVGPALGGILYGFFGIELVFIINGISFAASAISEMFIKYNQTTEKTKLSARKVMEDMKEGFIFLKDVKGLLVLLIFCMVSNFLVSPVFAVVFPFFAREVVGFSGQQFGLLQTSWVAGILLGNVILGAFLAKRKPAKLFKNGLINQAILFQLFFVAALPFATKFFGGATWIYFSVIGSILLITGIFNAFVNTPLMTMFHKKTPTKYRSRVFSVISVLAQLVTPLGAVLYGIGLDLMSTHWLLLIANIGNIIIIVVFFARGLDTFFMEAKPSEV
jgi:MFS family permease